MDNVDVVPISPIEGENLVASPTSSQSLLSDRSSSISQTTFASDKQKDDVDTLDNKTTDLNASTFDPQSHLAAVLRCWLPELLASGLSVITLMSMVVVLWINNGRGADDLGLPYSLTLNGLIAALATLNRVFLMVLVGSALSQAAWLGVSWGMGKFIVPVRLRYLAILGAFISVLSLGFGTFTQQLISLEALVIKDPGSPLSTGNLLHSEMYQSFVAGPANKSPSSHTLAHGFTFTSDLERSYYGHYLTVSYPVPLRQ
ncbi:uncharacterized protein PAC_10552 [Phialocephala subalpina]|uniref:Uncharacterized protein n=1 Tax=Phialocephala subalpina TaxID=576137 RepID=A0A1L7X6K7_9HELO|nr:uncharacterized protein PAC_10552 [Phialocephala subalpina]